MTGLSSLFTLLTMYPFCAHLVKNVEKRLVPSGVEASSVSTWEVCACCGALALTTTLTIAHAQPGGWIAQVFVLGVAAASFSAIGLLLWTYRTPARLRRRRRQILGLVLPALVLSLVWLPALAPLSDSVASKLALALLSLEALVHWVGSTASGGSSAAGE